MCAWSLNLFILTAMGPACARRSLGVTAQDIVMYPKMSVARRGATFVTIA
jgi:hypothetical protein